MKSHVGDGELSRAFDANLTESNFAQVPRE
jgi:hypothetical protein